jgi:hypothetical protein
MICYKSFNENYPKPDYWYQEEIIEETVLFDRTIDCACGINVGTLSWCEKNCSNNIYKCIIEWEWLPGICVPYGSKGKIRAEKVRILGKLN